MTLDVGAIVETPEACVDFLGPLGAKYFDRMERASYRVYLDLLLNRPDISAVDVPALVIGGGDDAFFTEEEWRDTANSLDADLVMLPGVGHQPMWDDSGRSLIDHIDHYVRNLR